MPRYFYETERDDEGEIVFTVRDRHIGYDQIMAICSRRPEAERIVEALNALEASKKDESSG